MSPRGPGRPRTFDEGEVLHTALTLFWEKGVRATTTRELSAATGVGQSSLHKIFGTKSQILGRALDHYESIIDEALIGPMDRDEDGLRGIRRYFDELVAFITAEGRCGCLIINLMAEPAGLSEELTERIRCFRGRLRQVFLRALQRAAARGEVGPEGLEPRSELLMLGVLGVNSAARGGAPVEELRRMQVALDATVEGWRLPAAAAPAL